MEIVGLTENDCRFISAQLRYEANSWYDYRYHQSATSEERLTECNRLTALADQFHPAPFNSKVIVPDE